MALGSMTFCLSRAGLWPLPEVSDVELSLLDLYRIMTSLVIHDIGETADKPQVNHGLCNPRPMLMKQIEQVMHEIPDPYAAFHIRHLEEQAMRLRSHRTSIR